MEEGTKLLPVNSNDQLYHILKTDTFTFCLICLQDINSTSRNVRKHLNGTNHAESNKCLFKACNPSLVDDVEDERFVDIVLKSVFDISVLLGKETCYVCKKENYWFCLMCEQNISERNLVDGVVKDNIIDHVLSNPHVVKVKEVCFLYRLNGNQDFLLLNKSVVYCSVCKVVMPCKDVDLLKTTTVHLEMNHLNYAKSSGLLCDETSSFIKQEELMMTEEGFTDEEIPDDYFNNEFVPRTEFGGEENISMQHNLANHKDIKNPSNKKQGCSEINFCICLCCAARVKPVSGQDFVVTLGCHFKRYHHQNVNIPLDDFINRIIIIDKDNDPEKTKLISQLKPIKKNLKKLIQKSEHLKNYISYIFKTEIDYVCIICMVSMSPSSDDTNTLLKRFLSHFNCSSHHQCEKEQMKRNQTFEINKKKKTLIKVAVKKESQKQRLQKFKANKKEKQAKIKLLKVNQNQIILSKLEETPSINQEDRTEIHASLNCSKVFFKHFQNHTNSSCYTQSEKEKSKTNQAFEVDEDNKTPIKIKSKKENLKKKRQRKKVKKNETQIKIKILHPKQNKICLSQLKKTRNTNQKIKKEVHVPLNCNKVLSEHFNTHSNSSGHTQSEREKVKINQGVKVHQNSKTLTNVQSKKERLKKNRQRRKDSKNETQTKIKLSHSNQNLRVKLKEKSNINQIVQQEIHEPLDHNKVLLEHFQNHSNSSSHRQSKRGQIKIIKAFKTMIELTVQKENLKKNKRKHHITKQKKKKR